MQHRTPRRPCVYIGHGKRVKSLAGRNKAVDIDYVGANANVITITRRQRRDQNGTSGAARRRLTSATRFICLPRHLDARKFESSARDKSTVPMNESDPRKKKRWLYYTPPGIPVSRIRKFWDWKYIFVCSNKKKKVINLDKFNCDAEDLFFFDYFLQSLVSSIKKWVPTEISICVNLCNVCRVFYKFIFYKLQFYKLNS